MNKIMPANIFMMFGLLFILVACQSLSNLPDITITPIASKDQASTRWPKYVS